MFGFPLAAAQGMGGTLSAAPQSPWYARLFDRFNPGGAEMSDADKAALFRQGLLGLAAGMAQTGGQGTAGAIGNGLQSGLLAMNKGRDDVLDRKQRAQALERGYGDPSGLREFEALAKAAGYEPGSEEYKQAAGTKLGTVGRASSAGVGFETWTDENGVPRPARMDPRSGNYEIFYAEQGAWLPLGAAAQSSQLPAEDGSQIPVTPFGGLNIGNDIPPQVREQIIAAESQGRTLPAYLSPESFTGMPAGLGRGRTKEAEAAAVAAAQKYVELGALPAELGMRRDSAIRQEEATTGIRTQATIEQERQGAQIKTDAEFAAGLPKAVTQAEEAIGTIDKLINHPARAQITGLSGALDPRNRIPGTPAKGAQALLKQIQGQTFLQAFESLKGGGQITQVEGEKAQQAKARLDAAQSDEEFVTALQDFRDAVETGMMKMRLREREMRSRTTPAAGRVRRYNPATGRIE